MFWGRDAPSVADLLYHDEGTTSSVLRTVRTSDIVPRLAASAARGLGGYLASPSSVAFPIVWMGLLILSPHVGLREVRGSVSCVVAEQSSSAALLLWPTRLDLS